VPSGAAVIRYAGKRGVVWRLKYIDAGGQQVMETLGREPEWDRKRAEAELRERLVRVERKGYRRPQKLTFGEYGDTWLNENAAKRRWSDNTHRAYRGGFKRLRPFFGRVPLGAIRPRHVAAFTAEAVREHGPTTVNQDLNSLHNVLASAVREELIETNPAHRPERPKVPDHEFTWRILEPGEVAKVLKSFRDERARLVFLTAILTAMRRHELSISGGAMSTSSRARSASASRSRRMATARLPCRRRSQTRSGHGSSAPPTRRTRTTCSRTPRAAGA
jgi:hypothetical protein